MGKPLPRNNNKKFVLFLWMFPQGSVHLELLCTDITQPAGSLWLFMWKRHLGQWLVKCVETILRKYWKSQNTFKNSMNVFWLPGKDVNISDIFYKKEKVYLNGQFPSSPTYSVKNLRSTALWLYHFWVIKQFRKKSNYI